MKRVLFAALLAGCAPAGADVDAANDDLQMGNKPWDAAAEKEWSDFVAGIGQARADGKCTTVNTCLNDKTINPLKADGDADLDAFADCSKLALELRAYFAIKTGRPFKYMSGVIGDPPPNLPPGTEPDYRYTANNHPVAWSTAKTSPSMQALFNRLVSLYHSGFYRMAPEVKDTDTYPIDVRPGTVRPGTVFYDPNGHVLVVYKVDAAGTVYMIDGHPDNSLSHTILSDKLAVGGRSQGGGFRNFRPIDARSLAYTPNEQLVDLADTQYGRGHAYYDWVRSQLSGGKALGPDAQLKLLADQLCTDVGDRVAAVDAGKHLADGPMGDVPPNIYGADGDWEAFSTPGRDGKLRASFRGIFRHVTNSVTAVKNGDPNVPWSGTADSLVAAFKDIWGQHLASCKVTYTSSAGAAMTLTLADVQARIYDLSFDPYHCVEMRWGAHPGHAAEAASCATLDADHTKRFDDERRMRNAIDRPPAGTPTPLGDWGPETPEDVDVGALLDRL